MGRMEPDPAPMPFSGKKAHKQAADHVANLMAQMHDTAEMPESAPETQQAQPTGPDGA